MSCHEVVKNHSVLFRFQRGKKTRFVSSEVQTIKNGLDLWFIDVREFEALNRLGCIKIKHLKKGTMSIKAIKIVGMASGKTRIVCFGF